MGILQGVIKIFFFLDSQPCEYTIPCKMQFSPLMCELYCNVNSVPKSCAFSKRRTSKVSESYKPIKELGLKTSS